MLADGSRVAYSPVVRAGGFVFVSGQLPFDADRRIVSGGIEEHTFRCYSNVAELLSISGVGLGQVVKTVNYLSRKQDFAAFNRAYRQVFGDHLPARSTVCARLLVPHATIEVDVIAYCGG